jgi:enoyl-CoA hydratase/carnithine racemase
VALVARGRRRAGRRAHRCRGEGILYRDRRGDIPETEYDPFTYEDPGRKIGPKSQELWKPVIAAVNGMACAGGFYLLGESDVIIAADHATFFDPHVTYAMTAAFEPFC